MNPSPLTASRREKRFMAGDRVRDFHEARGTVQPQAKPGPRLSILWDTGVMGTAHSEDLRKVLRGRPRLAK